MYNYIREKKIRPMKKYAKIALYAGIFVAFITRLGMSGMSTSNKVRTVSNMLPRDIINNGGL